MDAESIGLQGIKPRRLFGGVLQARDLQGPSGVGRPSQGGLWSRVRG
jgi:hypothetical protein